MTGLMSKLTHCLPGKHQHDEVDGFVNEEDEVAHPHAKTVDVAHPAHHDGNVLSRPADGTTAAAAVLKDKTAAPYTAQPGVLDTDKHANTTTGVSHPPVLKDGTHGVAQEAHHIKPEFAAGMGQTTVAAPATGITPGTGIAAGHAATFAPPVISSVSKNGAAAKTGPTPAYGDATSSAHTTSHNPTPANKFGNAGPSGITTGHNPTPSNTFGDAAPTGYNTTGRHAEPATLASQVGAHVTHDRAPANAAYDTPASVIPTPAAAAGIAAGMLGTSQAHSSPPLSQKQPNTMPAGFAPASNEAAHDNFTSSDGTSGGAAGGLQRVKEAAVAGVEKAKENVAWAADKAKQNVEWGVEQAKATTGLGAAGGAATPVSRATNPAVPSSAAAIPSGGAVEPLLPTHVGLQEDVTAKQYATTGAAATCGGGTTVAKPVTEKVKDNVALAVDKVKAAVGVKSSPAAAVDGEAGREPFPAGEADTVYGTAGGVGVSNKGVPAGDAVAPYDTEVSGFGRALDPITTDATTVPVVQRVKENAAWAAQKVQDNVAWAVGRGKPADEHLAPMHMPVDPHADEVATGGLASTKGSTALVPDSEADVVASRDVDTAAATTTGTAGAVVQRVKENAAWAAQKVQENAAWAVGKGKSTTPADEPVEVQQQVEGGLETWLPPVNKASGGIRSVTPAGHDAFIGEQPVVDHSTSGASPPSPLVEKAKENATWAAQKVKENAAWVAGKAKGMVYPGAVAGGEGVGEEVHRGVGGEGYVSKDAMEAVAQEMSAAGRHAGVTSQPGL